MEIDKVLIVGAGLMGSGIAQVCAQSGIQVILNDIRYRAPPYISAYDKVLSQFLSTN